MTDAAEVDALLRTRLVPNEDGVGALNTANGGFLLACLADLGRNMLLVDTQATILCLLLGPPQYAHPLPEEGGVVVGTFGQSVLKQERCDAALGRVLYVCDNLAVGCCA